MWDFTMFEAGEKTPVSGMEFICIKKLQKNVFASISDADKAGNMLKREKYVHFPNYDADIGVIRKMGEGGSALVIGVADFLLLDERAKAKRLARAKEMVKISLHYGVEVRVCSLARNEMELRGEYELKAVGKMLGMEEGQAKLMGKKEKPM